MILFCLTAAQIAVMITNGRSDDQVDAAAGAVADNGISLFAVGECGARAVEDSSDIAASAAIAEGPPPLKFYLFIYFFLSGLCQAYLHRTQLEIRVPNI